MKKKYIAILLASIGAILLCVSVVLACVETASVDIIGGADWPTFRFMLFRKYSDLVFIGVAVIIIALIVGSKNERLNKTVVLMSPILLHMFLFDPYQWLNDHYIVEWLGCGCKTGFNANHFTKLFWMILFVCSTVMSIFLSKRISKDKIWLKIIYIIAMVVVSAFLAFQSYRVLMWN